MADYATLLRDQVTLTCRSVDRVFLQGWVPKLQSVGQVCTFLRWHRGFKIPSSAAFGAIGDRFIREVERYAKQRAIPLIHFKKGEDKEEFVRPYLQAAAAEGGEGKVVLIGVAQEKASVWRSWKAKGHEHRSFGVGRRVCAENWHALRAVGESANRRLCDAEAAAAQPAPDVATFLEVTRPTTDEGLYAPGLRFGEPRVMALLATLAGFSHLVAGFTNHQLAQRVAALLDAPYTSRQATYDLRRLRRKGLITRRPHSQRYDLTARGQRVVILFTKTHGRVLTPGLAAMDDTLPEEIAARSPLGLAWRHLQRTLDQFIDAGLAAA
jgi:hypothetical protein